MCNKFNTQIFITGLRKKDLVNKKIKDGNLSIKGTRQMRTQVDTTQR
jgi:hypothetical protein